MSKSNKTKELTTTIEIKLQPDFNVEKKIDEIIKRDRRVINRILGIIHFERKNVYSLNKHKTNYRTSRTILNQLMITSKNRATTKYDLKSEFRDISNNEIQECLDQANAIYISYLNSALRRGKYGSFPKFRRYNSRLMYHRRFKIDLENNQFTTIYSRESNLKIWSGQQTKVLHERISMKFIPNARARDYLTRGSIRAATIMRTKDRRYYAKIAVNVDTDPYQPPNKKIAMIGVDLGIAKTAMAVLYTKGGVADVIELNNNNSKEAYLKIEERIGDLQREKRLRSSKRYRKMFHYFAQKVENPKLSKFLLILNSQIKSKKIEDGMIRRSIKLAKSNRTNKKYQDKVIQTLEELISILKRDVLDKTNNIVKALRRIRHNRRDIKDDMIKQLCNELKDYIQHHAKYYDLYVTIGKPNGIQYRNRRGSGNKQLRKKINRWAFYKFQSQLAHNMSKVGMGDRLIEVGESWTSSICYQCNRKGKRPTQDRFYCSNYHCMLRIEADTNGAANIAKRGIVYMKLIDTKDYDDYYIETKEKKKDRKVKTKFYRTRAKERKLKRLKKNDCTSTNGNDILNNNLTKYSNNTKNNNSRHQVITPTIKVKK